MESAKSRSNFGIRIKEGPLAQSEYGMYIGAFSASW